MVKRHSRSSIVLCAIRLVIANYYYVVVVAKYGIVQENVKIRIGRIIENIVAGVWQRMRGPREFLLQTFSIISHRFVKSMNYRS